MGLYSTSAVYNLHIKVAARFKENLEKLAELDIRPPLPPPPPQKKIHRGSHMHAHVLLNLSNKLRKRDQKQGFAKHFIASSLILGHLDYFGIKFLQ